MKQTTVGVGQTFDTGYPRIMVLSPHGEILYHGVEEIVEREHRLEIRFTVGDTEVTVVGLPYIIERSH